jgi:hypothetical protein
MLEPKVGAESNDFTILRPGPIIQLKITPKDASKPSFLVDRDSWVLKCKKCNCQFLYTEGKEKGVIDELFVRHVCSKSKVKSKKDK